MRKIRNAISSDRTVESGGFPFYFFKYIYANVALVYLVGRIEMT